MDIQETRQVRVLHGYEKTKNMKVAALFAGCGGLDLGFKQAGFEIVWANEFEKKTWETYRINHPGTFLDTRSITDVQPSEIPDVDGFIGGPPCQSWSLAGSMRGMDDKRGQLFLDYIRLLEAKKPLFFLAENVKGILSSAHAAAFGDINLRFGAAGYRTEYHLLNAKSFGTPQDRERVILIGLRKDVASKGSLFPEPTHGPEGEFNSMSPYVTLRQAIGDLGEPVRALGRDDHNPDAVNSHECMTVKFTPMFMSRNRIRGWDEVSFTIQAGGRQAPLHPSCPPMESAGTDKKRFTDSDDKYRRLSVRECARIQDFPDSFRFEYAHLADGHRMIGNAVPVKMAKAVATSILQSLP
jgi:DNA (cytosine-5)-methyltransferase 1